MSKNSNNKEEEEEEEEEESDQINHKIDDLSSSDKGGSKDNNNKDDDLSWRITKLRLEEANTRQILSRKPLKLPYAQSQKWIQLNFGPKTQEEFEQLVMDGDIKNVYISKRPEEYYGARGEWISWEHYLLGSSSNATADCNLKWQ